MPTQKRAQSSKKKTDVKHDRRSALRIAPEQASSIYKQIIEQAADGIFTLDLKGVIVYANKAAGQILSKSSKKIIGTHFRTFIDRKSMIKVRQYFAAVKSGNSIIRDELDINIGKGRTKPIEFTASPILENGKTFQMHVSIRDISNRKRLEGLIRESDKMQAMQNFISGTTHEIKDPLLGLVQRSNLLIEKYKNRDFEYIGFLEFKNIIETLESMQDQAQYCYDTVNRLMTISSRKIGIKGSCNANAVIRAEVKNLNQHLSVGGINLKMKLSASMPQIAIGSVEFSQIIIKLLTNAIQAVVNMGTIEIKTTYLKKSDSVRIDFKDDGVGISKEILPHIFEPFFTTKHRGLEKSSGLGLSIVYSIIKAYRGSIQVESSLKKGTWIKITLPVAKSSNTNRR